MGRLGGKDKTQRYYERPKDKWFCGRAALGQPCRLGPSRLGGCQIRTACDPVYTPNGWACTRTEAWGGKCEEGPYDDGTCCQAVTRCMPVRNLRALRGRVVAWTIALTLAGLAWGFGGQVRERVVDPGPVIQAHAEVEGCASCHSAFEGSPGKWVLAAFRATDPKSESHKCGACHDRGEHAMRPHSLPVAVLAERTQAIITPADGGSGSSSTSPLERVSQGLFPVDRGARKSLACAACHKEHKGAQFDSSFVANNRCQSCHKVKFAAFGDGHPTFGQYPYKRRSRIAFDHNTHIRNHFPRAGPKSRPKTCADCHRPDPSGQYMVVLPFEKTCATCHDKDIDGSALAGAKGIPVFAVPGLDASTLRRRGYSVGRWPSGADGEGISPFVAFLLSGDPQLAKDLKTLADVDLQELGRANRKVLAAVRRVGWGIKGLLYDLGRQGADAVSKRLRPGLKVTLDRPAIGALMGHISLDVVRAAQARWFPRLSSDVRSWRSRRASLDPDAPDPPERRAEGAPERPAVRLALSGPLTADSMRLIAEALSPVPSGLPEDLRPRVAETAPLVQLAQSLLDNTGRLIDRRSLRMDDYNRLLRADRKANNRIFKRDRAPQRSAPKALIQKSKQDRQARRSSSGGGSRSSRSSRSSSGGDAERWTWSGGWYRSDYTLFYRPAAHEDAFIRGWLDVVGAAHASRRKDQAAALLAVFRNTDTVGRCVRCHSVDKQADESIKVNWRPFTPVPGVARFTVFNHATHFSMAGEAGCLTCHSLDPRAAFAESYKDFDATTFQSSFRPIDQQTCTECHTPNSAGDNCVQCHRYHVGVFQTPPAVTQVLAARRSARRLAKTAPVPMPKPDQDGKGLSRLTEKLDNALKSFSSLVDEVDLPSFEDIAGSPNDEKKPDRRSAGRTVPIPPPNPRR